MSQSIPFVDANFKLAVVQELMYNQGLLPRFDLREYAAGQGFTYDDGSVGAVPEALAYFEALEVPVELAEKITEIEMDGGNEIYLEIAPNWGGEDGLFDVDEFAGLWRYCAPGSSEMSSMRWTSSPGSCRTTSAWDAPVWKTASTPR